MEKISCPFHQEATASCVIYEKAYHCFGCGAHGPLSDLGLTEPVTPRIKYVENLEEKFKYIDSLPRKLIRGFDLPYDEGGYYLVFPDRDYYKYRVWDPDSNNKYRSPAGHPKPIFWARHGTANESGAPRTLALVEGEANSLSLAEAFPEWDACSPGSASDFKTEKTRSFLLTYCMAYRRVVVIVDRDGAGTEAAIHAKGLLLGKVPTIPIVLMETDANQILCEFGKEKLRQEIKERVPNL